MDKVVITTSRLPRFKTLINIQICYFLLLCQMPCILPKLHLAVHRSLNNLLVGRKHAKTLELKSLVWRECNYLGLGHDNLL
jgi:hypothetical protein